MIFHRVLFPVLFEPNHHRVGRELAKTGNLKSKHIKPKPHIFGDQNPPKNASQEKYGTLKCKNMEPKDYYKGDDTWAALIFGATP